MATNSKACSSCFRNDTGAAARYLRPATEAGRLSLIIAYDGSSRLVSVTDAIGLVTTNSYELTNDIRKITQVTDPFGRAASFQYNTNGQLTRITVGAIGVGWGNRGQL